MRSTILTMFVVLLVGVASAQVASSWEVRKKPSGVCAVSRIAAKPSIGTHVAGPYKTERRAREELVRLRKTPRCK